ncbi:Zinc transporter 11 [Acorus gramineus]|uniref:Zinc transporter 11 n=1 Tax=Acorus gramineus TaxID=55184 RepID=A0AAV9B8C3_ACOGR|nr:Zinc transporter 11 [Acorus gramineus]
MSPPPLLLLLLSLAASATAHGGEDPPDLRSRSLIAVKLYCLVIVFASTFAGGISPYFLKWNEGFLLMGTQFAGGVFLGTAMMHFLSDSDETFGDLTEVEYPFAFMLACVGYLVTMVADCVIAHVCKRKGGVVAEGSDGVASVNVKDGKGRRGFEGVQSQNQANGSTGFQSTNHSLVNASSLGDSVLLIVALCFHSVFEGIAIGVAENKADAWKVLWTVSLHKVFAAIAMGIALLRMIPDRPLLSCTAYAFAFAISSPIGVAIGIVIDATTQGNVADWIYAISMGLACGVFIYVSINHLLSKGYVPQRPVQIDSPFRRWLAVVFGVGVIAVVMIWDT